MTETTIITTPYPPTSEIICALINKGWCIDSVKRETCKDDFDHYVLEAHVVEVKPFVPLTGEAWQEHIGRRIDETVKWPKEGE